MMRARLADLCRFTSGGTPSKKIERYYDGDIPWITGADIVDFAVQDVRHHITDEAVSKSATTPVPAGTVLLVTRTGVGKVAVADRETAFSQDITAIHPDANRLDPRYLAHYLRASEQYFLDRARGATIQGVSRRVVEEAQIPLPPLDEQRRIAAILDRADALRAKRRRAQALLDDLLRSVFVDMFGELITNTCNWPTRNLGGLIVEGPQNGLYRPASDYGSGSPIVRIDSFYDGTLANPQAFKRVEIERAVVEKYRLNEGDILINRVNSREYLGKAALVEGLVEPTVFESNMMRFSVDASVVRPLFLVRQLQSPFVRHQILTRSKDSVNQSSINQQDVASLEIRVPPIELQDRFEHVWKRGQLSRERMLGTGYDALYESLAHRAFRGELTEADVPA